MTEMTREQLSAFLDDELEEREADLLVRRLSTDADLRGAAVRYAVMGDAIRTELPKGDPRVLLRRVSASVASEAAVSGPAGRSRAGPVVKALAGAAIAASVAVVAVLSLDTTGEQSPVPVQSSVPERPPVVISTVSSTPPAIARAGSPSQLRRYYLNHSQYATNLGGQGSLVRMVRAPEVTVAEPAPSDVDRDENRGESPE